MTARHILPALLIAALAVACSDSSTPATGPRTTTNPVMAASVNADGAALGPGCEAVVGTFFGEHKTVPAKGWYGTLYLSIAGGAVETPDFYDRGVPGSHRPHGSRDMFSGKETNTITFSDGSTFDIAASYNAQPTGTPGLFVLHETGSLTNGTGDFAGVSGHVAVDGPFTFPPDGAAPHWIAEMHGSICGLQ